MHSSTVPCAFRRAQLMCNSLLAEQAIAILYETAQPRRFRGCIELQLALLCTPCKLQIWSLWWDQLSGKFWFNWVEKIITVQKTKLRINVSLWGWWDGNGWSELEWCWRWKPERGAMVKESTRLEDVQNKMFTIKRCSQFGGQEDIHCNARFKGCKRPPGRFQDNLMRWF